MAKYILLIDDDQDDADIFSDAVNELGLETSVRHFADGNTALEFLSLQTLPLPDIIFLDINMPLISGWTCLKNIKQLAHLRNIPIVMYTTSNLTRETISARDIGASAFLTKPSNFADLKSELSSLFRRFL